MSICLHIIYDCFPITMALLNGFNRDSVAHKLESIFYLALYRKSLPNPWFIACRNQAKQASSNSYIMLKDWQAKFLRRIKLFH